VFLRRGVEVARLVRAADSGEIGRELARIEAPG